MGKVLLEVESQRTQRRMKDGQSKNGLSPGEAWLSMKPQHQVPFLAGIIDGLNQGLRHCSGEIAFALATRLSSNVPPDNKLTIDSLIQQTRIWSKSSVVVFKYSKPLTDYADILTKFYRSYPQYHALFPAYLMIYMDDQHAMGVVELYALHTHSLQGFKL